MSVRATSLAVVFGALVLGGACGGRTHGAGRAYARVE